MKTKYFFLWLLLILVIPPFLMKDNCTIITSKDFINQIYAYKTNGNTQRITCSYDSLGTKPSVLSEALVDGVWIKSSEEKYIYNKQGNILSYIHNYIEDNKWSSHKETNNYDSLGNIITSSNEAILKGIPKYLYNYTYTHNTNDILIHSERFYWDDDHWEISGRSTSKANSKMQMVFNIREELYAGKWLISSRDSNVYDELGRNICSLQEFWDMGKLWRSNKQTVKFDTNGYLIFNLIEGSGVNDSGVTEYSSTRETYDRLKTGKILTYLKESNENGNWVKDYQVTNQYDINENIIISFYESKNNEMSLDRQRSTKTYNSNADILTTINEIWLNEKWNFQSRETYTYDSNNNLLKYLAEQWVTGVWINNQQRVYTYDSNYRLLTKYCERWKNENWQRYQDEIYTYDSNGKVLSFEYREFYNGIVQGTFRKRYQYNSNGNLIKENCETKAKDWRYYDTNFSFGDLYNNTFFFFGYQIDITYNGFNSVKDEQTPSGFSLNCSPNPTSGQLNINYTLTEPAYTSISISNLLGIEIAKISENQLQLQGNYTLNYDAGNFAPGVYFVTIKAGNKSETQKIGINY